MFGRAGREILLRRIRRTHQISLSQRSDWCLVVRRHVSVKNEERSDPAGTATTEKGETGDGGIYANFKAKVKEFKELKDAPPSKEKEEQRLQRLEDIKSEIRRGYFWEVGQIKRTNNKIFETDKEVLPAEEGLFFPSFEAESLTGTTQDHFTTLLQQEKNQVSLVAISFRDFAFLSLPKWIKPFREEFGNITSMKVFQVSFEEKKWLRLFRFLIVAGQKSKIEPDRHAQSFLRFGNAQSIKESLAIENRMVAYIYLVDSKGRARWRATGDPSQDELDLMFKCARDLRHESNLSTGTKRR